MSSFAQWCGKFPEDAKLLFVCGPANDLVDYVVEMEIARRKENGFKLDTVDLASVGDVKNVLMQETLGQRLVFLLTSFDKLKNRTCLVRFLQASNNHLIIRSSSQKHDIKTGVLKDIVSFGRYVRCVEMEDKPNFVRKNLECSGNAGDVIVDVCGGNLCQILQEIKKLKLLGVKITEEMVYRYCCRTSYDSFVEDLFRFDRVKMFSRYSLEKISVQKVISALEKRIRLICYLLPYRRGRFSYKELADGYGVSPYMISKYLVYARGFSFVKIKKWIDILFMIESRFNSGVADGLLERLLVLW